MRIASYNSRLANLYNMRVKPSMFQPGDPVLRTFFENIANLTAGKFQPNLEGPCIVTRTGESGSYSLDKLDSMPVPRMLCTLKGTINK